MSRSWDPAARDADDGRRREGRRDAMVGSSLTALLSSALGGSPASLKKSARSSSPGSRSRVILPRGSAEAGPSLVKAACRL